MAGDDILDACAAALDDWGNDPVSGHKLYDLTLLQSGGQRQIDTDTIVQRYDQRIAASVLADFIMLGAHGGGSLALARTKVNFFATPRPQPSG